MKEKSEIYLDNEDLKNLDECELLEILATLEGMEDSLKEEEQILKEEGVKNENEL